MASIYSAFLQSPNASHLASDASLNYITTTTSLKEPATILKHFTAQNKQVEKKAEKVLSAIEGPDALCVETQTTLAFKTGGGAYLPGIDENLLDEKDVTIPMVHVVQFNAEQKIQQIRIYWDQGTMLKEVEAIGRTGRNWPIREGNVQIDAISKSLKAASESTGGAGVTPLGSRNPNEVAMAQHKKNPSSATHDPHASLALFAPRDPNEEEASRTYSGPKHAPRLSAKPGPREYGDLFAAEDAGPKSAAAARSPSPSKADGTILKGGAGKNFSENRLFEDKAPARGPPSPERKKVYDQKYEHFEFGDGEDAPAKRPTSKKSDQGHFEFGNGEDAPAHKENMRPSDERHWGAGVDENKKSKAVPQQANEDDYWAFSAPKVEQKIYKTSGNGMGGRTSDFLSQEDVPIRPKGGYKTAGNGMGGRSDNQFYEHTPETNGKKVYKTQGDGMGGNKSTSRGWGFGDESCDEDESTDVRPSARRRVQA